MRFRSPDLCFSEARLQLLEEGGGGEDFDAGLGDEGLGSHVDGDAPLESFESGDGLEPFCEVGTPTAGGLDLDCDETAAAS
jgi:hypothetical protein